MKKRPLIIGIGGSDEIPEPFTMHSIKGVIEAGIDGVMVNTALTKDGMPIILNRTTLSKICSLNKDVYDVEYSTIEKINHGDFGFKLDNFKIPTLTDIIDYLNLFENSHLLINIIGSSMKARNECISLVAGMVQDIKPRQTYISSDSFLTLKFCKRTNSSSNLVVKINTFFPFIHYIFSANILDMNGMILSPSFTASLVSDNKAGRNVFTKIDNINMIDDAFSIESDFILTSKPIEVANNIKEKWRFYA